MSLRRRAILLALSLILGAATTITIALAFARLRPLPQYPRTVARAFILDGRAWSTGEVHLLGAADIWWSDLADSAAPPPRSTAERAMALLGARPAPSKTPDQLVSDARRTHTQLAAERPGFTALDSPPSWGTFAQPPPLPPPGTLGEDAAFGFPFPCLWYRVLSQARGNASIGAAIEHGYHVRGTPNARATGSYTILPLRPIWPALIADSAIFASLWGILLFIPGPLRRFLRRRRGKCPHCAYDLRATPTGAPCPECGAPTK
ncbi:MAG: hypothetical protein KF745_11885 [Phycisphaeraceae bacterium]|nr:hypothetical protein [Phycisphaeraceae bacterium]